MDESSNSLQLRVQDIRSECMNLRPNESESGRELKSLRAHKS